MNAALHIMRKDLRKLLPIVMISTAVAIFGYVIALSDLDTGRYFAGGGREFIKLLHQAPLLRWIFVFLVSAWAVLEDPGVGDGAAWLTRPIRGRDLVIGKVLFIMVGVSLPAALVSFGVTLWLHASAAVALTGALSSFVVALAAAALAGMVAVVSATMIQTILALAGGAFIVSVLGYAEFQVMHTALPPAVPISPGTSFIVGVAVLLAIAAVALACQYSGRRRWLTIAVAAALAIVGWSVAHFWAWDFWPQISLRQADGTPPGTLRFQPTGALDYTVRHSPIAPSEVQLSCPFILNGLPPDRAFEAEWSNAVVRSDGSFRLSTQHIDGRSVFENQYAGLAALGYRVTAPPILRGLVVASVPLDQFGPLQGRTIDIDGRVSVREKQYRLEAELPVQAGATRVAGGKQAHISYVSLVGARCELGFEYTQVRPALGNTEGPWTNQSYLINRARGEFSPGQSGGSSGTGEVELAVLSTHLRFAAVHSLTTGREAGAIDSAWIAGAKLCFFVAADVRSRPFNLPIAANRLTVPLRPQTHHIIIVDPDGSRHEFDQ